MEEAKAEEQGQGAGQALAGPKVRYTHKAMADLILVNPAISQNELALYFGYTPSWISTILCSDSFQAYLAEQREKLVDPLLRASIEENMKGLVMRSIEVLQHKLNKPLHQIPDNLALRTLELSAKAAGYGAKSELPPPAPQGNRLTILAHNLMLLNPNKGIPNVQDQTQALEHQAETQDGQASSGGG